MKQRFDEVIEARKGSPARRRRPKAIHSRRRLPKGSAAQAFVAACHNEGAAPLGTR